MFAKLANRTPAATRSARAALTLVLLATAGSAVAQSAPAASDARQRRVEAELRAHQRPVLPRSAGHV